MNGACVPARWASNCWPKRLNCVGKSLLKNKEETIFLRDLLLQRLNENILGNLVNGSMEHDYCIWNVSFTFVEGESMLITIRDVAVSSGSACTSASLEPSYVLRAIGLDDETPIRRFDSALGDLTIMKNAKVADPVIRSVAKLRALSSSGNASRVALTLKQNGPLRSWRLNGLENKVIDHYENPRNVGTLNKGENNVGTG